MKNVAEALLAYAFIEAAKKLPAVLDKQTLSQVADEEGCSAVIAALRFN